MRAGGQHSTSSSQLPTSCTVGVLVIAEFDRGCRRSRNLNTYFCLGWDWIGMYRLTIRYSVPGKIINPSKFNFFQSKILNRIVDKKKFCGINNIQSYKLVFCVQYFLIFTLCRSSESSMLILKAIYRYRWLNAI